MKDKLEVYYTDSNKIYLEIESNNDKIEMIQDPVNPESIGIMLPLTYAKKICKDLNETINYVEKTFS